MGEKVVWLAYSNPKTIADGGVDMLACVRCRNKTYRIECQDGCGGKVYCAACNNYIGMIGWMDGKSETADDPIS